MKVIIVIIFVSLIINLINGFHGGDISKRLEIQQASFQFLSAAAYRNGQKEREWCEDDKVAGGRPYIWSQYRSMVINYLDLYVALQFDPECNSNIAALRKLVKEEEVQPSPYIMESWWDNTLLPTMLDAFSCGFNGSKIEDFDFVSHDLLNNFNEDLFKQKIWNMIGTYMTGIYKQRENANRRLDFDSGLYIPFLDKYTGGDYTTTQQMRVGFPTYLGRTLWTVFHTIAQRVSDSACEAEPTFYKSVTDKFKQFMAVFPYNHACPFCKEHMISKVLSNDRYAKEEHESETLRFYPIEHLLLGGTGGNLAAKISSVTAEDKTSIAAFFWKLHNAVTSSVEQGCQCFTEEIEDKDPYHCEFNSKVAVQTRYPRQQRSYPFAKRFEFILTPDHDYELFNNTRNQFIDITTQINNLDSVELRIELYKYWNNTEVKISEESQSKIEKLMTLIKNMTEQFIASPILSEAYSYDQNLTLNCSATTEFFASLDTTGLEEPNLELARTPELCIPKMKPSACEAQYYVAPPKEVVKEEEKPASSNDSPTIATIKLTYLSIIIISLISFF